MAVDAEVRHVGAEFSRSSLARLPSRLPPVPHTHLSLSLSLSRVDLQLSRSRASKSLLLAAIKIIKKVCGEDHRNHSDLTPVHNARLRTEHSHQTDSPAVTREAAEGES